MGNLKPTGLELALLAVVVLVIAGAALIGGDEHSAKTATASRPAHIDVEKIERRVERMRSLRFRRPLSIEFATPQRAQAIIDAATRSRYSRRDELIDQEEMKLLGVLAPADDLHRYLDAIDREQVLGFYDDRSKKLVVIRGASAGRPLQEITLAHELTHALEDQHFGIRSKEGFSDDRGVAEAALFEGTATALMIDYGQRYFTPDDAVEALGDIGAAETKLPRFLEGQLIFPYEQGASFVDALRIGRSWRAVNKVMRFRRPATTEQVIHLEKYATGEQPAAVHLPDVAAALGDEWKRIDSATLGELDLRLLFRNHEAAAGWGGGRLELWRRPGSASCRAPCLERDVLVLGLAWDTAHDRAEGRSAIRRLVDRWSSRGGAASVTARGGQTRVVLAPDAESVSKILR